MDDIIFALHPAPPDPEAAALAELKEHGRREPIPTHAAIANGFLVYGRGVQWADYTYHPNARSAWAVVKGGGDASH